MAISDIRSELGISLGAFYHYYDSKPALLLALVERMGDEIEQLVLLVVHDPTPGALDKLMCFFATLDRWKFAHKDLLFAYFPVWYGDENAIMRHKLYRARVKRLAPWLEKIIQEGVEESVFQSSYADQTVRMIIALLEDIGYASADLLLVDSPSPQDRQRLERIVRARTDVLERLLGLPTICDTRRAGAVVRHANRLVEDLMRLVDAW